MTQREQPSLARPEDRGYTIVGGFIVVGRLCLDFAVTGGEAERRRFERLHRPGDLARWLESAGLGRDVRCTVTDLAAAAELREGIWWSVQAILRGASPPESRLRAINAAASRPPLVPRLGGPGLERKWSHPTALGGLSLVARDTIEMLSDPSQRARVRECASPDCRMIFYDSSRPGRRRWCAARRCGDRARSRAYRARKRTGEP